MSAPNKLKAPAVRKVKQGWADGASARDLAAEHDVSHAAILYQVEGVERQKAPRMGRPRSFNHERAAALVRQGFTYGEVAQRMGVSKSAISQALARMEWKAAA